MCASKQVFVLTLRQRIAMHMGQSVRSNLSGMPRMSRLLVVGGLLLLICKEW